MLEGALVGLGRVGDLGREVGGHAAAPRERGGPEELGDRPRIRRPDGVVAGQLLVEEAVDLEAQLVRRDVRAEAGEHPPGDAHLAVLVDRELQVVHRVLGLALFGHAHLGVEEAAGDVEGAQALHQLPVAGVGGLAQVERLLQIAAVERPVAVERGDEARPRQQVHVEVGVGALGDPRVPHLRAEEAVLAEHLAEIAIGVGEGRLVGARAGAHLVVRLEGPHLAIGRGLDDEHALRDRARRARLDLDGEDDGVLPIGVARVAAHLGRGEAALLVEAAHAPAHVVEPGDGELAARGDPGRVQRLRHLERAAGDLDGADEPPREHVDPQHHAPVLRVRLDVGPREVPRAQRLPHHAARGLRARRLAPLHRRERQRRPPAPAHHDHLDAPHGLAHQLARGRLAQAEHRGPERGLLVREEGRRARGLRRRRRLRARPRPERRRGERESHERGAEGAEQGGPSRRPAGPATGDSSLPRRAPEVNEHALASTHQPALRPGAGACYRRTPRSPRQSYE